MNIVEAYPIVNDLIGNLVLQAEYSSGGSSPTPYKTSRLNALKTDISALSEVPFIASELEQLYLSWLYQTTLDSISISNQQKTDIDKILERLRIKLLLLKDIAQETFTIGNEDLIYIRLPEVNSFDDLSKTSNELKKGIEIPITDDSINGKVKIVAADRGSIIFYVSLGSILAVKVIGAICWSAAFIRRKMAEAKIFEAQARTLDLKNEALSDLINAQKNQLKNMLDAEAQSIASNSYSNTDPETIGRIKMSISAISDLIDKGAKIAPLSNDDEVKKAFPDYSKLNLIESTIKQLKDSH